MDFRFDDINLFVSLLSENQLKLPISFSGMAKKSEDDLTSFLFSRSGCKGWVKIPITMVSSVKLLGKTTCIDHDHDGIYIEFKEPQSDRARTLVELWRGRVLAATGEQHPEDGHEPRVCYCTCTVTLENISNGTRGTGVGVAGGGPGGCQPLATARAVNSAARNAGCGPRQCKYVTLPDCDCSITLLKDGLDLISIDHQFSDLPVRDNYSWAISGQDFVQRLQDGRVRPPVIVSGYVKICDKNPGNVLISRDGKSDWVSIDGSMIESANIISAHNIQKVELNYVSIVMKENDDIESNVFIGIMAQLVSQPIV